MATHPSPQQKHKTSVQVTVREQSDALPRRVVSVTTEFLRHMGVEGEVIFRDRRGTDSPHLWLEILARENGLLIGEHGSTLRAFEHVLRLVLRPVIGDGIRVIVDVNAYRIRRMELLRRRAREAERRVRTTGRAVVLEPMNAVDRRVVHLTLATEEGVRTESQGEEPERRVVVRPVDPLA